MRITILSVVIISIFLTFCSKRDTATTEKKSQTVKQAIKVKVIKTVSKKRPVKKVVYGETRAFKTVDIFSKVNGVVVSKRHKLGDRVPVDAVLAVVRQDIPGMEFADYQVKSTVPGTVVADFVETGSTVTVSKPLMQVAQLDPIVVEANVPEEWSAAVKIGGEVSVRLDALPGKTLTGKVFEILPEVNAKTRSLPVRVKVQNTSNRLLPGMFARVTFNLGAQKVITVPVDAVMRNGLEYFVFVVKNGVAQKRAIKPGELFAENIVVESGLAENEQVVVFGQNLLDEGIHVEVEEVQ